MKPAWGVLALFLLAAASRPVHARAQELVLTPVILQHALLVRSSHVTAGGVGGGLGLQARYRAIYLAQLDVSALWTLGNPVATRFALGVQRDAAWAPAAFGTINVLWGDRIEFVTGDGRGPARPSWALGVRGCPLRFISAVGQVSLLEPGIATDFQGALWLELSVIQVGASF
jgi:hypothetical protein